MMLRTRRQRHRTQKRGGGGDASAWDETGSKAAVRAPGRSAPPGGTEAGRGPRRGSAFLREAESLFLELLLLSAGVLLVYCFLFGALRVSGNAMYPGLRDGDLVLYYRPDKDYAVRDLLILEEDGKKQVRRVAAVAGDTVDFADGKLVLDGIPQDEAGVYEVSEQFTEGMEFPVTVPEGEVFVLGDAREHVKDSRIYGNVRVAETYGTVMLVVRRRGF